MADDGRGLLRGIVRAQRRRVIVSSLGGAAHQACEALVPVLIGVIVDRAIEPSDGGSMVLWTVLLAVLFVVLNSSYRVQFLVVTRASELAEHDLRMRLTERVLEPGGIAGAGSSGELLSIASSDARRAVQVLWAIAVAAAATSALVTSAIFLIGISVPGVARPARRATRALWPPPAGRSAAPFEPCRAGARGGGSGRGHRPRARRARSEGDRR